MACEPFCLIVLTPGETLLDVTGVTRIQVQLADSGGLGIYPGHAPLLAETVTAPLTYWDSDGEHSLEVNAGILHIRGTQVSIFTSGLTRSRDTLPERFASAAAEVATGQTAEVVAEQMTLDLEFDRLAQELIARMRVQPEDAIETMTNSDKTPVQDRVSASSARGGIQHTSPAGDSLATGGSS